MKVRLFALRLVAAGVFFFYASPAASQQPVCAPLARGEGAIVACRSSLPYAAAHFLDDFSVDHLFKPVPWSFDRTVVETVSNFAQTELKANPEVTKFLNLLPPVRFTQLDRTTGVIGADFRESDRELHSKLDGVGRDPTLTVKMPEHLEGGYWRGPDALQIAFWERKRIGVRVEFSGNGAREGELRCLALSPDGLLLRFTPDDVPPLLVRFQGCQESVAAQLE